MPKDNAQRVVEGARQLSPYLGQRMLAAKILNRPVVVRELLPQDLKLEMDQLRCEEAVSSARFLAGVVGRAHARQLDTVTQNKWRSELNRCRSKNLDAPSWLGPVSWNLSQVTKKHTWSIADAMHWDEPEQNEQHWLRHHRRNGLEQMALA